MHPIVRTNLGLVAQRGFKSEDRVAIIRLVRQPHGADEAINRAIEDHEIEGHVQVAVIVDPAGLDRDVAPQKGIGPLVIHGYSR